MKILIDMNLSPAWEVFFNENNLEAIHWSKVGNVKATDKEIFHYAQKNEYFIFTIDLDFGAILASSNSSFPSVFQLKSQELLPSLLGNQILQKILKFEKELIEGSLITFDIEKVRVRILRIRK